MMVKCNKDKFKIRQLNCTFLQETFLYKALYPVSKDNTRFICNEVISCKTCVSGTQIYITVR